MCHPDERIDTSWLRAELVASWREIAAVLFLTLGYFIFGGVEAAFYRFEGHYLSLVPTNYRLLHLTASEGILLALFLGYLHWRGWTPSDLKMNLSVRSSLQALFLLSTWITAYVGIAVILYILHQYHVNFPAYVVTKAHSTIHHPSLSWSVLIVSQVMNAFVEEVTVMGYAFNQFAAKRGTRFAIWATTLLRISYHTWKQPVSLLQTGVAFFIFGVFYSNERKLWPLVMAHIIFDVLVIAWLEPSMTR